MSMGGGGNDKAMSDINVTPLVDVMLVLLIIFMITAPMMNNSGVDIDLPKVDAPPLDRDQEDQLIISIDGDLNYYINDSMFPKDEMRAKLKAIAEANPGQAVFLEADGTVPYSEVAAVVGDAKLAGMPRVGLVFDPLGAHDPKDEE